MPNLQEILKDKEKRLDTIPNQLSEAVKRSQKEIFAEIRIILESFERDGDYITTSESNIARITQLKSQLQNVLYRSEYAKAVKVFVDEFDRQADISQEVFAQSVAYEESAVTAALMRKAKRSAADALLGGALDAAFYSPVINVIDNAVATNSGFVETVRALQLAVMGGMSNGGVVEGRLDRYTRQIASDLFAITDRSYNNQVSAELGIEFYRYTGGLIEDTREFCKSRNGNYYHRAEVESWVTGDGDNQGNPTPRVNWPGQYRGTNTGNIFNYCGGYNCKHTLMPVATSMVPKDVLRRNLASGNLSLTPSQMKTLGL